MAALKYYFHSAWKIHYTHNFVVVNDHCIRHTYISTNVYQRSISIVYREIR